MKHTLIDKQQHKSAKFAGFAYLFLLVSNPISLLYIPSLILDRRSSHVTAQNLLAHESLFRFGAFLTVLGLVVFIFLALFLYRLFRPVNEHLALLMRTLVLVSIPISFILAIINMSALLILKSEAYTSFDQGQMEDIALMLFRIGDYGGNMVQIFWGLWLLPFGFLVYQSGFIPKIFGVLLVGNGIAYTVLSVIFILIPKYLSISSTVTFPLILGELWVILWLVIKGIKVVKL